MSLETSLSTNPISAHSSKSAASSLPPCNAAPRIRHTKLLSEQNNLFFLKRTVSKHLPVKKFKAYAPNEFSKLILSRYNTVINENYSVKYNYPADILSNIQLYHIRFFNPNRFIGIRDGCYKKQTGRLKTFIY